MSTPRRRESRWTLPAIFKIRSTRNCVPRFVAVPCEIPRHCVATYFPEANLLVPIGSVALRSNTPQSKAVVVSFALVPRLDDGLKNRIFLPLSQLLFVIRNTEQSAVSFALAS
jgi:hypothetical protein